MPDQKKQDSTPRTPRDAQGRETAYQLPPTDKEGRLVEDAAAEKAAEKAETAATERAPGAKVPNAPVVGTSPFDSVPAGRPAGEARPSVEVPTYAPPEQTGQVIGVAVDQMPIPKGKAAEQLHRTEQKLQWLIQHQPPTVPPTAVPQLVAALGRVRSARYAEREIDEAGLRGIEMLLSPHLLPESLEK